VITAGTLLETIKLTPYLGVIVSLIMIVGRDQYLVDYIRPFLEEKGHAVVAIRSDSYSKEVMKVSPDLTVLTTLVYSSEKGVFFPYDLVTDSIRDRKPMVVFSALGILLKERLMPEVPLREAGSVAKGLDRSFLTSKS